VLRAANLQFARIVDEFVRWRGVPEDERSAAPGWWWGPAFEVLCLQDPLPDACRTSLGLPAGATYGDGARVFLESLAGQTALPWPDHFPRKPVNSDPP